MSGSGKNKSSEILKVNAKVYISPVRKQFYETLSVYAFPYGMVCLYSRLRCVVNIPTIRILWMGGGT